MSSDIIGCVPHCMSRLRIFICHASEDKPLVRDLCRQLRRDGFEPWVDEEKLLPGQDWEFEIAAAVSASDIVIVCLTSTSVNKVGYVQKELRRVLDISDHQPEGRIFVIPVRLEECAVPIRLSQWQYADVFVEGGYERLCAALKARVEGADGTSILAPRQPDTKRLFLTPRHRGRNLAIAAAVAVSAAVAAGIVAEVVFRKPPPASPSERTTQGNTTEPAGMVRVPGGRFLMGRNGFTDPEASPAHEVTVEAFLIDQFPVTNARFRAFLRSSDRPVSSQWPGGDLPSGQNDWPVTGITWDEAYACCLAQGKRLPSETEWEFAARGADGRLYPWSEVFDPAAVNSRESELGHPQPVGSHPMNRSPYNVIDMSGNIWQWCADDYRPYPGRNAGFAIPFGAKVIRGGSFLSDRLHVTTVSRNLERPSARSAEIGFRCAK